VCVVVREVDRLGHLGVALVEGLACLGSHHLEQFGAAVFEHHGSLAQVCGPLPAGQRAPLLARLDRAGDHRLELLGRAQQGAVDQVVADGAVRHPGQDGPAPGRVRRQRRVCVGHVVEGLLDLVADRAAPVLHPVRLRYVAVQRVQRGEEPVLLALEQLRVVVQVEHRGHEVLPARTLLEAADQVGDGDVELVGVHDRRVEQQAADLALDHLGLALRHPEQHLELDAAADAALAGQQPGECDVEQVVPGDTDPDVADPVEVQRVVEHPLVVGVGVLLAAPGRQRPVVQRGLDPLHRQVRALDHADLDRRTTAATAGRGPLLQLDHRAEGVGQVGLQHDAGLEVEELRLVEQSGEHRDRHVEVAVLLHVEVDELLRRRLRGPGEQRCERLDDVGDGLVERPCRVRRDGG
jgi:hypothetical protein